MPEARLLLARLALAVPLLFGLAACPSGEVGEPDDDNPPVTRDNRAPVVTLGGDRTAEIHEVVTLEATVVDDGLPADGTPTYRWTSDGNLQNEDTRLTTVWFERAGAFEVTFTASDGELDTTARLTITVTASTSTTTPTNAAPVVDAGGDRNATVDLPLALAASVSDDGLPADRVSLVWSGAGPGNVAFTRTDTATTSATFDAPGTYTLELTADDGALVATDTIVVTVSDLPPENQAPMVDAGGSVTVIQPGAATLLGTVTDDGLPNGNVTVAWTMAVGPGIVAFTAPDAPTTDATFTAAGTYRLRLTADDGALMSSDEVVVLVRREPVENLAPTVSAGASMSVVLPNAVALQGVATDDGMPSGALTIAWSQVSGPGTTTFADASDPTTSATFDLEGAYQLRLTADDGALSSSSDVMITVSAAPPSNAPPSVNAGTSQTVRLPNTATLNGTATDDGLPNGTLTTTWSRVSGPGTAQFAAPSQLSTTVSFSAPGTYVLRLLANDGALSGSSNVTVTVLPPINQPPTVNAGASQTITLPNTASLNGSASDDGLPAGSSLVTTWSVVSGPGTVSFANAMALATTASFSTSGTYVLRLTADDSAASTASDVTITVQPQPNQAPAANAGPNQTITLPATAALDGAASDDGLPASFLTTTWSRVSGPGTVTFGNAAALSTTASFSAAGTYVLRLTANDGALADTDNVSITVNPAPPTNQAPTVSAGPDRTITLPSNATLSGTATDDGLPSGSSLVTTWTMVSGPGAVAFGNANQPSTTASFTTSGTYVLRLTGTDSVLSSTDDVTVTVNPAPPTNQAPTVNAGANQTITLPATATLNGTASDDGLPSGSNLTTTWTVVSGPGTVAFGDVSQTNTTASFSTSGTYVLRLTASDSALTSTDDVTITVNPPPQAQPTVLMFVAYNDVWWAEYKVVYEALLAAGYAVDVRSSANGFARSDYSSDINATPSAQGLDPNYPPPASYSQFTQLFAANFGASWNSSWNARANIPLNGRIQDVPNMNAYVAFVMPGGAGQVAYRYDGTYAVLGPSLQPGTHVTSAGEVQAAANAINTLIADALSQGKIVAAECHGAPLVAFARVPGSTGGYLGLGRSVLEGRYATGYPFFDGDTPARYNDLGVTLMSPDKVVVDGPDAPDFSGNGRDTIVTSTDWYPETAAYFARTLLNMLETYPTPANRTRSLSVLVYGGDEPTNYPPQAPGRYTDLVALLSDPTDDLAINATGTNTASSLTAANLANYDVLVYFGHDAISTTRQNAIANWVDAGGGLVGLHHAIYNHGGQKGVLVNLFQGELPAAAQLNSELGVVYAGETNRMINVNLGHYVSTYGVHLFGGQPTWTTSYTSPRGLPNANLDNDPARGYYHFSIPASDELYPGADFVSGVSFGRGTNQVNRLFSNDRFQSGSPNPNNGAYDTAGWVRLYDGAQDGTVGRIVYLQPGETAARTFAHPGFAQAVKNAVVWAAD